MNSPECVLVDTSAWIIAFRGEGDQNATEFLKHKIILGQVATTPLIILELIQGCKTEKERDQLRSELESLQILDIDNNVWEQAYDAVFHLRRNGITVPTIDIILVSLALEHNCILFHFDRHFLIIARYLKNLNLMSIKHLEL